MKLKKSFQLALNIFLHSKLRSWLTIIGIIIGIGAVVAIVSISEGAQRQLEDRLGNLGADVLTITPGFSQARGSGGGFGRGPPSGFGEDSSSETQENLTSKDLIVLKNIENVDVVMGTISGRGDLTYSSKTASVSIKGIDPTVWKEITTEEIDSGRFLTQGETYSVILGERIAKSTFENEVPLNSKVIIEGKSFKVVGILNGGSTVYILIDIARTILEDVDDKSFDSISVKIKDVEIADETVELIEKKLMFSRGALTEKDKDFTVTNPLEMQETMQETMNTMAIFLGAIAAISLLVGGIGIANTMFTSVLEKTKDIGIMKAIGAKNRDIMIIFLLNSGLIGLVGGLGGIILGTIGSSFISVLTSTSDTGGMTRMFGNTTISPSLLIFALLFSILIGMVAGTIPAYRASKLRPVDALRYE